MEGGGRRLEEEVEKEERGRRIEEQGEKEGGKEARGGL